MATAVQFCQNQDVGGPWRTQGRHRQATSHTCHDAVAPQNVFVNTVFSLTSHLQMSSLHCTLYTVEDDPAPISFRISYRDRLACVMRKRKSMDDEEQRGMHCQCTKTAWHKTRHLLPTLKKIHSLWPCIRKLAVSLANESNNDHMHTVKQLPVSDGGWPKKLCMLENARERWRVGMCDDGW